MDPSGAISSYTYKYFLLLLKGKVLLFFRTSSSTVALEGFFEMECNILS